MNNTNNTHHLDFVNRKILFNESREGNVNIMVKHLLHVSRGFRVQSPPGLNHIPDKCRRLAWPVTLLGGMRLGRRALRARTTGMFSVSYHGADSTVCPTTATL